MIDDSGELSVRRQCEMLSYNRSNHYYVQRPRSSAALDFREEVMRRLDYWSVEEPAWGLRKLVPLLKSEGLEVSHELVRELRGEMGLETIYPKENTSKAAQNARKQPYLLRTLRRQGMIWLPNQVWSIDITYIKMGRSHMYMTAIIDWMSRYLLAWELSETLKAAPTIECVKQAIERYGQPAILNSDQGSQFTSDEYMALLAGLGIRQSMDGRGRWADNVVIERLFRSLKVENVYINEYVCPRELRAGIAKYFDRYNNVRPHQSLEYRTPASVYHGFFKV
jgi:putative transposase